jgi:hypothetical protein
VQGEALVSQPRQKAPSLPDRDLKLWKQWLPNMQSDIASAIKELHLAAKATTERTLRERLKCAHAQIADVFELLSFETDEEEDDGHDQD